MKDLLPRACRCASVILCLLAVILMAGDDLDGTMSEVRFYGYKLGAAAVFSIGVAIYKATERRVGKQ